MNHSVCQQKALSAFLALFCISQAIHAGGGRENPPLRDGVIIASTSWVAAIASCAGAENVRVLAPSDLRHPPEYELKPSDLNAAGRASLIIYAGWEMFARKLAETAGSAGVRTLQIAVTGDPEEIKAEAKKIAELLGTTEKYEAWVVGFDSYLESIRTRILGAYIDKRIVVNRMQTPFMKWAGFEIAGEYGPAEPSPALILSLVNTKPVMVIDNYHSPVGRPIAEAAQVPCIELLNFPGKDGTKTIEDVFRYNTNMLVKVLR
jgi:hypothetical protein